MSTEAARKSANVSPSRDAAQALPEAGQGAASDMAHAADDEVLALPTWLRRSIALGAIVVGWGFIAWHNHLYFTPAVVILALGWAASVSTVYFLWRVGAAGAVPAGAVREDWWLEENLRQELEREKRTLLKTIREIEFDQQTGKLSPGDAEEMSRPVRLRAIEVIKQLDAAEAGGGARAEIEREVRARLEIEKARRAAKKPKGAEAAKAAAKVAAAKPAAKGKPAAAAPARSATAVSPGAAADPDEAAPLPDPDSGDQASSPSSPSAASSDAESGSSSTSSSKPSEVSA